MVRITSRVKCLPYQLNRRLIKVNLCLSVHRCLCVEKKTQLDVTECFIALMLNMFRALLCPTSGARDYMCVISAYGVQWLLVVGGQMQDSRVCVQEEGCCTTFFSTHMQRCTDKHTSRFGLVYMHGRMEGITQVGTKPIASRAEMPKICETYFYSLGVFFLRKKSCSFARTPRRQFGGDFIMLWVVSHARAFV